jgi:hypothetical protein
MSLPTDFQVSEGTGKGRLTRDFAVVSAAGGHDGTRLCAG